MVSSPEAAFSWQGISLPGLEFSRLRNSTSCPRCAATLTILPESQLSFSENCVPHDTAFGRVARFCQFVGSRGVICSAPVVIQCRRARRSTSGRGDRIFALNWPSTQSQSCSDVAIPFPNAHIAAEQLVRPATARYDPGFDFPGDLSLEHPQCDGTLLAT